MNSRASTALSRRSVLKSAAALSFLPFTPIPLHAEDLQQASNPTPTTISRRFWDSFDGLAKLVQSRMIDLGVPGSAFGVVHGTTRTTCTEGVTRIGTTIPVEPQTLFRVASLSKLFTGSAIASLIDAGVLELDRPVHSYLPQFQVRDPAASQQATIRHLVTHSAGWEGTLVYDPGPGDDALAQYVAHMRSLPQVTKPGEYFSYSNSGVILAGHLVAQVMGQTFESAVRDMALSPLSMEASSFLSADVTDQEMVFGHVGDGERVIVVEPWSAVRAAAPTYGLLSNIDELLSFAAFHAKTSLATPANYLSATAREQMHSPLGSGGSIGPIYVDAMGINWMLTNVGGAQVSLHAGNDFGQCSMIAVVPSEGFAVAILTNSEKGQSLALEAVMYALDSFTGLRMAGRKAIDVPTSELETLTGKYEIPGGPKLNVTRAEDGLVLDVSIDGEHVAEMSGPLVFVGQDLAELHTSEMPLLIDFIREDGVPKWVRHLGQLATRVGG